MRTDEQWRIAADHYRTAKMRAEDAEQVLAEAKELLLHLAGDNNENGYGVSVTHSKRKGSIDYHAAASLHFSNEELENFRKEETTVTSIKISRV